MKFCYKCETPIIGEVPYHGLHLRCFCSWFGFDSSVDFTDIVIRNDETVPSVAHNSFYSSFFQGKFKKYSARLSNKSYIFKVQQEEYPELPRVEYISNKIAQGLGIAVPNFYLIHYLNEIDTFVVDNFMEQFTHGNLIHIYHYIEKDEEFSVQAILRIIKEKVARTEGVDQFVFLCLFDALIGNHDRHGRNIALIETSKGFQLAPFYDNPSYLGIEAEYLLLAQHNPRGKIATSHTLNPTIEDYIQEFERLGFHTTILSFVKQLQQLDIDHILDTPLLSEKRRTALSTLIHNRKDALENALQG
ncbi:MAG: HipA domain-containing protein [Alphaproteobacteria bacterium]